MAFIYLIKLQCMLKTVVCNWFSNVCVCVQCVSGTDSWQRVNTEIPVKSPRFALFDLAEGKSYRFRVRCCNSAGVGEPSEPTEATTVGDKLGMIYSITAYLQSKRSRNIGCF